MKELLWIGVGLLVLWYLAEPAPVVERVPTGSIQFDLPGISGVFGF